MLRSVGGQRRAGGRVKGCRVDQNIKSVKIVVNYGVRSGERGREWTMVETGMV